MEEKGKRFEDYIIYKDGRILSLLTGKMISKRINTKGYYAVNLCINGQCKTYALHRLVAISFLDNPRNLPQVNHKDGNKLNNKLENLEWVTAKENVVHAIKTGLVNTARGKRTKNGRFEKEDIDKIRDLHCKGLSFQKIANRYNVSKSAIQFIVERKTYAWVR